IGRRRTREVGPMPRMRESEAQNIVHNAGWFASAWQRERWPLLTADAAALLREGGGFDVDAERLEDLVERGIVRGPVSPGRRRAPGRGGPRGPVAAPRPGGPAAAVPGPVCDARARRAAGRPARRPGRASGAGPLRPAGNAPGNGRDASPQTRGRPRGADLRG